MIVALAAIAAAKSRIETPVGQPEPSPPPSHEPEAPMVLSKEAILAKQKIDADTLDRQLQSEEVDPFWASKVERATAEGVARIGSNIRLADITCRETLCRARLSHADPRVREEDLDQFMNQFLSMPVIAGQAMALSPDNDDRSTLVYFSRKGTTLSPLQAPTRAPPADLGLDLPPSADQWAAGPAAPTQQN